VSPSNVVTLDWRITLRGWIGLTHSAGVYADDRAPKFRGRPLAHEPGRKLLSGREDHSVVDLRVLRECGVGGCVRAQV
jgi:hypothetical protein